MDHESVSEQVPSEAKIIIPFSLTWFRNLFKRLALMDDQRDLASVTHLSPFRKVALEAAQNNLKKVNPDLNTEQLFRLASTDLFVEKAQLVLTRRAKALYICGIFTIVFTVVILGIGILMVRHGLLNPVDPELENSLKVLILRVFQTTALSAFLLVGVKLLISLSRSFFHEALSLFERRHALRFGRLFIYLKKGELDYQQFHESFQWNKETRTSFLDMRSEIIAETLLHKAIDGFTKLPPETLRLFLDAKSNINKHK
jgi:hypothetical protein